MLHSSTIILSWFFSPPYEDNAPMEFHLVTKATAYPSMGQTSNDHQASPATVGMMPCAVTFSSCRRRSGWLVSGGYLPWESPTGASCRATGVKVVKNQPFIGTHAEPFFFCRNQSVPEHLRDFYGRQPEAVRVAIVVARPSSVALDERSAAELLQAGTRGGQGLTGPLCASTGVLRRRGLVHLSEIPDTGHRLNIFTCVRR